MIRRLYVTGYKASELSIFSPNHQGIKYIKKALIKHIKPLIVDGDLEWIITSGQQGVEWWASEVAVLFKKKYPHIKLAIITPYLLQQENWKIEKQEAYQQLLDQADFVDSVSRKPYQGPWQFKAKNQFLLDHTDALLLLYDDEKEGSPKYIKEEAIKRAENSDYKIFTISAYDLQQLVEEEQFNKDW